jgi:AcrR family transcriptional regulator
MIGSKDRILDAAERIVLRDGVSHLTLDAVAAETAMSKGGLLYHFPAKDDLIVGMIARLTALYDAEVARREAADPCPTGRKLRAVLGVSFSEEPCDVNLRAEQVAAALLAAVATKPDLLNPMRERARQYHEALLQDDLDPVLAMIIHLAGDGLWLGRLFGLSMIDAGLQKRVVGRLIELSKGV